MRRAVIVKGLYISTSLLSIIICIWIRIHVHLTVVTLLKAGHWILNTCLEIRNMRLVLSAGAKFQQLTSMVVWSHFRKVQLLSCNSYDYAVMKRSQDSLPPNSPPTSPFPAQKKQKVSPSTSEGLSTQSTEGDDSQGWTKVEKRAAKKLKKTENKHNVCVHFLKLSG